MLAKLARVPDLAVAAAALGALYFALTSGHLSSIDGLLAYRQGESIAYEHSLLFGTPLWWGQLWTTSKYGIGLSLLYLPGLLVGSWLRPYTPLPTGTTYDWSLLYSAPYYAWVGAPIHVIVTVVAAYMVAMVCKELGLSRSASLWGLALYGVGSPAIIYARGDWGQQLEGLCWIAAIYGALRFGRTGKSGALLCSVALAYAILTRPVEGVLVSLVTLVLIAPSMRWRTWSPGEWRAILILLAGCVAGVGITLLVNWARYGLPFNFGYAGEGWTTPLSVGLPGSVVSPARGILWEFPAIVLAPLGFRWLFRNGSGKVAIMLTALILLQLLSVSTWSSWWGGWDFGLRLFVPALPVVAVLAACGLMHLPHALRNRIPALLVLGGLLFSVPCVLTDLNGGYGAVYDGTSQSFRLDGYPLLSAFRFLQHIFASGPLDMHGIDILWVRLASVTDRLSLVPMFLLLGLALAMGFLVVRGPSTRNAQLSVAGKTVDG